MIEKPNPPNPRIIREDFLPEDDEMKNYRIKRVEIGEYARYTPEHKYFGLFWWTLPGYTGCLCLDAKDHIRKHILTNHMLESIPKVEYIEITEKDLDLPEPNPPLLRP